MTLTTLRNKRLLLILIIFLASFFFFGEIEACTAFVQGGGENSCEKFPPGNHHITSAFTDWTIDGGAQDSGYFGICAGPPEGGSDAQCHFENWSGRGAWSGGWTLTDGSPGNWTWADTDVFVSLQGDNFVRATSNLGINSAQPSVDMGCNFLQNCSISYNTSAQIGWLISGNAWSCSASGDWSGSKNPAGGSEPTGNLTSNKTYTLTCSNPTGSASDSTTVSVGSPPLPPPPPPVSCGPKGTAGVAPVTQTFTASGGDGTYSWSAPGGSPSSGAGSSFTSTFSSAGSYLITVTSAGKSDSCDFGVLSAPPPACGNGVVDPGEQCDTGSNNGACPRTCSSICTVNDCGGGGGGGGGVCGNGVVDPGEQCDTGSNNGACPRTCSSVCTNNSCGTGGSCIDDGAVSFSSPPPSVLTPGQVVSFGLNALNTGNDRWWHPAVYSVMELNGGGSTQMTSPITGSYCYSTIGFGPVCYNQYPGDTMSWTFNLTAPSTPGSYTLQMMLDHAPSEGAVDAKYLKPDGTTCPAPLIHTKFGNTLTHNFTVVLPTADIKAAPPGGSPSNGPITISYNTSATISWTSSNASSCSVSPTGWTGTSNSGISTGNLISSQIYALTCSNAGTSVQDSVQVNVGPAPRTLTVSKAGNGSGTVTSTLAGVNCGSDCSETYDDGTNVGLNASPAAGSLFSGWSGDCSGAGSCNLSMTSDKSVTATFTQQPPSVTTNPATNILTTSATLNAQANPNGISATGWFRYSATNPGSCNDSFGTRAPSSGGAGLGSGTSNVAYSQSISGLSTNTPYYFCAIASNSGGTGFGSVTSFTTAVLAPTVDLKCDSSDSCGTVGFGSSKTLSWSITNGMPATLCTASNGWSGSKGSSGSESTGAITSNKTWTIQCSGPGGTGPLDSVSATVPAPEADIRCDNSNGPCDLPWGSTVLLEWCGSNAHICSDAASCSVTKNGSSWSSGTSGSPQDGPLVTPGTYTYGLTCSGNGSTGDSVTVSIANPVPATSNVSVTLPDYCVVGPSATINWNYSDPSGSPQLAYQVQIDNQGSFGSPEVDSGKIFCQNCRSYFSGSGVLQFNTTYQARVRTWNQFDSPSPWQEATICSGDDCKPNASWKTPTHAYPNANSPYQFTWSPLNPSANKPVQFADHVWFDPSSNNKAWSWIFVPAGGGSGSSTAQNPSYTFNGDGIYQVTESVRDNALPPGQFCTGPTQPVNLQKPIPIWKEVAPR